MLCKLQTTIPTPHLFQINPWTNDSGKEIDCNHKNDKGEKNRKIIKEGISWFDLGVQAQEFKYKFHNFTQIIDQYVMFSPIITIFGSRKELIAQRFVIHISRNAFCENR
jgi:hypothetical protein